jgi:hypothetical protein
MIVQSIAPQGDSADVITLEVSSVAILTRLSTHQLRDSEYALHKKSSGPGQPGALGTLGR